MSPKSIFSSPTVTASSYQKLCSSCVTKRATAATATMPPSSCSSRRRTGCSLWLRRAHSGEAELPAEEQLDRVHRPRRQPLDSAEDPDEAVERRLARPPAIEVRVHSQPALQEQGEPVDVGAKFDRLEPRFLEEHREPVGSEVADAERVEGLELRGRAHQVPAGYEHARHLRQQRLRPAHVLEDLLAVDELELRIGEGDRLSVEGGELRVGAPAGIHLGRGGEIEPRPADGGIEPTENVDRVSGAAPQVENPRTRVGLRAPAPVPLAYVCVGEELPAVVARHTVVQQLEQVVAQHAAQLRVAAA